MMKPKPILSLIAAGFLAGLAGCQSLQANSYQIQFACDESLNSSNNEYIYTTVASDSLRHHRTIIRWETEDFSGNGFPPKERCHKVSPRFQQAYDTDKLKFLTHGTMNKQPVICTARGLGEECDTLIMTLRHSDDADKTLAHLSKILRGDATTGLEHDSGDVHEVGGRKYVEIDIEHFLSLPES